MSSIEIEQLISQFQTDTTGQAHEVAHQKLVQIGGPAVPGLITALEGGVGLRFGAARTLAKIGVNASCGLTELDMQTRAKAIAAVVDALSREKQGTIGPIEQQICDQLQVALHNLAKPAPAKPAERMEPVNRKLADAELVHSLMETDQLFCAKYGDDWSNPFKDSMQQQQFGNHTAAGMVPADEFPGIRAKFNYATAPGQSFFSRERRLKQILIVVAIVVGHICLSRVEPDSPDQLGGAALWSFLGFFLSLIGFSACPLLNFFQKGHDEWIAIRGLDFESKSRRVSGGYRETKTSLVPITNAKRISRIKWARWGDAFLVWWLPYVSIVNLIYCTITAAIYAPNKDFAFLPGGVAVFAIIVWWLVCLRPLRLANPKAASL